MLSWSGVFDSIANHALNDAILNAGILYGTSRAINSAISLLQTTQISIVFLSVDVGELLDPVNDVVERFSEVMTYAIASLVAQKFLTAITEHAIFNITLTLTAIGFVVSTFFRLSAASDICLRGFLFLFLIRTSVISAILLGTWVSALLVEPKVSSNHETLTQYEKAISNASESLTGSNARSQGMLDNLSEELARSENQQHAVSIEYDAKRQKMADLERAIAQRSAEIGTLKSLYSEDESLARLKKNLTRLEAETNDLASNLEQLEDKVVERKEALDCATRKSAGENCGIMDWLKDKSAQTDIKGVLEELTQTVPRLVESTITLLVLVIFECVLFPLMFWFLFYQLLKKIWRLELGFKPQFFDKL